MSFQPPQQPTKKRLGGLRIFALVIFGITALLFLIAILASGSNTNNDDQAAAAATTAATADTTTSEPAETLDPGVGSCLSEFAWDVKTPPRLGRHVCRQAPSRLLS